MKILSGYRRKKNSPGIESSLLKKIKGLSSTGNRRAVFDLDNTILNGDIGDALFCRLKNLEERETVRVDGKSIDLTWSDYTRMISDGEKEIAYKRISECMESVPVRLVADLTRELMNSDFRYIEHSGEKIPIPHVDPGMKTLLDLLQDEKFEIYIISASNSVSVKVIAREYLAIDEGNAFGIEPKVRKLQDGRDLLTGVLNSPVPVNNGKAALYRKLIGGPLPLITAGDSELDLPMLDLVDKGGLVFWRGKEGAVFNRLKDLVSGRAGLVSLLNEGFSSGSPI